MRGGPEAYSYYESQGKEAYGYGYEGVEIEDGYAIWNYDYDTKTSNSNTLTTFSDAHAATPQAENDRVALEKEREMSTAVKAGTAGERATWMKKSYYSETSRVL